MPFPFQQVNKEIKSHTCEEGGAHLISFLVFIDELEKQIIVKKTVKLSQ